MAAKVEDKAQDFVILAKPIEEWILSCVKFGTLKLEVGISHLGWRTWKSWILGLPSTLWAWRSSPFLPVKRQWSSAWRCRRELYLVRPHIPASNNQPPCPVLATRLIKRPSKYHQALSLAAKGGNGPYAKGAAGSSHHVLAGARRVYRGREVNDVGLMGVRYNVG